MSVLTVQEAADDLRVPASRVMAWIRQGLVPAYQTKSLGADRGRRGARDYRIDVKTWEAFKESLLVAPPPNPELIRENEAAQRKRGRPGGDVAPTIFNHLRDYTQPAPRGRPRKDAAPIVRRHLRRDYSKEPS